MKLVATIFERGIEAGLKVVQPWAKKLDGWDFSHQLSGQPPPSRDLARLGRRVREPSAHVAGVAGWLLSIITSHAPEDGCNRCAPAIADGCNGCAPAILPKMAAI